MSRLPDGWTVEPFAQVARYATGRTPARANPRYWTGPGQRIPWVSISDMEEYGIVKVTKEGVTSDAFREVYRGRAVPAGTLLMSFKLTIGRVATLGVSACHNEAIISIYPRAGVDQRYLGYFLSQVDYSDHQDRQVKGNTLNQSKIDRIPVALPPEGEQWLIASVLDRVRAGIRLEDSAVRATLELKRSLIHSLFARGLRGDAQKESEIGPIPDTWQLVLAGSIATKMQYGLSKRGASSGRYPILRMNCIADGKVVFRDLQYVDLDDDTAEAFMVHPGDLLFNRTNSYELVGRTAIMKSQTKAVFASYLVRIAVDRQRIVPDYLNHLLNCDLMQSELKKLASRSVSQANISAGKLKGLAIPLPASLDEQHEIAIILDAISRKIDLHRRKRAVLDELFKTLRHRLMTGEVRASDLDLSVLGESTASGVAT